MSVDFTIIQHAHGNAIFLNVGDRQNVDMAHPVCPELLGRDAELFEIGNGVQWTEACAEVFQLVVGQFLAAPCTAATDRKS